MIAASVKHWQELKDQGKLDEQPEEEEDIYAKAKIGEVQLGGGGGGGVLLTLKHLL